jgi:acetate kinase
VNVLVVNAGSSSLKLRLLGDRDQLLATADLAGDADLDGGVIDRLRAEAGGVPVDAVGHRVVHGGPVFTAPTRVADDVRRRLGALVELAPLHVAAALAGIDAAADALPGVPAVACFDTAFHAAMPPAARTYALPRAWNERWSLRRYGFHGLSHAYAVRRAAEVLGRRLDDLRVVSCHLGAGASLAAVVGGRSVDTTMGFTPLEGLVMATRSGTVDPGLLLWLLQHGGVGVDELAVSLEQDSGLKGLSGTSGDLRDVLDRRAGDPHAALAYDVFVHRLRREVGAMTASAGGLDVLVMTGGIGEHSATVRADVVAGLDHLGLAVDAGLNASAGNGRPDADVSTPDASARTVVVAASEETEIARQTTALLGHDAGD